MVDDSIPPRFNSRPWHRRKRSVQGKDWAPPTAQSVHRGVWCPKCKVRHPYNGHNKLVTQYERRKGDALFRVMWCCPITLDVIGELEHRENPDESVEDPSDDHDNQRDPPEPLPGDD